MKLWKVLGIAGLAGVAATGVIMARDQRQRAQLEPHEIRSRLHDRLEQAGQAGQVGQAEEPVAQERPPGNRPWRRWLRLRRNR